MNSNTQKTRKIDLKLLLRARVHERLFDLANSPKQACTVEHQTMTMVGLSVAMEICSSHSGLSKHKIGKNYWGSPPVGTKIKELIIRMSTESSLTKMYAAISPVVDVIFVHGLTGDPKNTWCSGPSQEFWPKWLVLELNRLDIYTLGYPSSLFGKWEQKEMDLPERANNILELLAGKGIGSRPIVFVAHSLGGLLVKFLLRRALDSGDKDYELISNQTRMVFFLATPHKGASLAGIVDLIPGASKQVGSLANKSGFLEDLNQFYRNFASKRSDLQTYVYYEKLKTNKAILVVDRDSADPGVSGVAPVPVDRDHAGICKPPDKDDVVFLGVRRHLTNLCKSIYTNAQLEDDFSNKSESDRRDLLQKLVDAGREHEYQVANNAQNKFARRLAKYGLFSSARNDYEQLLSDACTRFTLHVYHPLICMKQSDATIRKALQDEVIGPLANKACGETVFTENDVYNALYFLTEQCHIRWDIG